MDEMVLVYTRIERGDGGDTIGRSVMARCKAKMTSCDSRYSRSHRVRESLSIGFFNICITYYLVPAVCGMIQKASVVFVHRHHPTRSRSCRHPGQVDHLHHQHHIQNQIHAPPSACDVDTPDASEASFVGHLPCLTIVVCVSHNVFVSPLKPRLMPTR